MFRHYQASAAQTNTPAASPFTPCMITDEIATLGWWGLLRTDLAAKATWMYNSSSTRSQIKVLLTDGTMAMIYYRLMQASHRAGLSPFAMVFNKLNTIFGNCIIGRGAEFGAGFVLVHSTGVVINGAVRGGRDIKIEHQVTIGAERGLSPVLGDDLFIGAGAKIIGAVRIGSHSRIGANAVVIKDVPEYVTAVGVPARYIPRAENDAVLPPSLNAAP